MRKRNPGFLETLYEVAALLPWWVGLALAVGSYFLMQWIAAPGPLPSPTRPADVLQQNLIQGVATAGKFVLPLVFGLGATASLYHRLAHRIDADPVSANPKPIDTTQWNLPLLKALEWKRFEHLCAEYFREIGLRAEMLKAGPDAGVDIRLFAPDQQHPGILVQCKSWSTWQVGVKPVRELYGVMAAEGVPEGIFATTSTFTPDAKIFAMGKSIHLIDGLDLLAKLRALDPEAQQALLAYATQGDYTTPSCPSCGNRMLMRKGSFGRRDFWGCRSFPACRTTLSASG
jgi:hypothetical protein